MARHTKSRTTTEVKKQPQATSGSKQPSKRKSKYSAANTANFFYFSKKDMIADCKNDKEKIKKACNDTEDNNEKSKNSLDKSRLNQDNKLGHIANTLSADFKKAVVALDSVGKAKKNYSVNDNNKWLENHCTGLWNKPGGNGEATIDGFKKQVDDKIKQVTSDYKNLETQALDKVKSFAKDYFKNHAKEIAEKAAEKAAKRAALYRFPVLSTLLARYSLIESTGTLLGNAAAAYVTGDMEIQMQALESQLSQASTYLAQAKKLNTVGGLEDAMATTMAGIAKVNPCISARKCLLVPYNKAGSNSSVNKGSSCCPGQTGHHILPNAMFFDKDGKKLNCWANYTKGGAPTICLEGTTHRATNGSHGLVHQATAKELGPDLKKAEMTYEEAKDKTVRVLSKAFGCNEKCLKKQLDEYYDKAYSCQDKNRMVTPHSGMPNKNNDRKEQDGNNTD